MVDRKDNKDSLPTLAEILAQQDPMRMQALMSMLALANTESHALLLDVLTGKMTESEAKAAWKKIENAKQEEKEAKKREECKRAAGEAKAVPRAC